MRTRKALLGTPRAQHSAPTASARPPVHIPHQGRLARTPTTRPKTSGTSCQKLVDCAESSSTNTSTAIQCHTSAHAKLSSQTASQALRGDGIGHKPPTHSLCHPTVTPMPKTKPSAHHATGSRIAQRAKRIDASTTNECHTSARVKLSLESPGPTLRPNCVNQGTYVLTRGTRLVTPMARHQQQAHHATGPRIARRAHTSTQARQFNTTQANALSSPSNPHAQRSVPTASAVPSVHSPKGLGHSICFIPPRGQKAITMAGAQRPHATTATPKSN